MWNRLSAFFCHLERKNLAQICRIQMQRGDTTCAEWHKGTISIWLPLFTPWRCSGEGWEAQTLGFGWVYTGAKLTAQDLGKRWGMKAAESTDVMSDVLREEAPLWCLSWWQLLLTSPSPEVLDPKRLQNMNRINFSKFQKTSPSCWCQGRAAAARRQLGSSTPLLNSDILVSSLETALSPPLLWHRRLFALII